MDFFSLVGIKLAEPSVQTNHGRLETTLVETQTLRPDSEEGVWSQNSKSDSTSQQKHATEISRVYLLFNDDVDDPSSAWADVFHDDDGDASVHVKVNTESILKSEYYLSAGGKIMAVDDAHKAIDEDGDIVITVDATALPLPEGIAPYSEQTVASDLLFTLLKIQAPGPAYPGLYNVDADRRVAVWTRSGVVNLPLRAPVGTAAGQYFF